MVMIPYRGPGYPIPPVEVRVSRGYLQFKTNRDLIRDSIKQILGTRLGERCMNPQFGSRIHELIFEQEDSVFEALVGEYVVDAIKQWEPRIRLIRSLVNLDDSRNRANILLQYIILSLGITDQTVLEFGRDLSLTVSPATPTI